MSKRIVICADGTWNRPEQDLKTDVPTNVLRLARAIKPRDEAGMDQQVFYDWGVGSYYDSVTGGVTGKGLNKNIMDDYRYIVQNYTPGDELFLFGFSRGAYTVRSLSGLIYNCGILKRPEARLIQAAFDHYKKPGKTYAPDGDKSKAFRRDHSHNSREIAFIGVWDTVGALGVPFSVLGLLDREDEFYDTKLGPNVRMARHALAIDEQRVDFEPTVWQPRDGLDLQQVWFAGSHSDVGGGHEPDDDGSVLSAITLDWMAKQARAAGLAVEGHLHRGIKSSPTARLHPSRRHIYRFRERLHRPIDHGKGEILIHRSVKQRWQQDDEYRPKKLAEYLDQVGWPSELVS